MPFLSSLIYKRYSVFSITDYRLPITDYRLPITSKFHKFCNFTEAIISLNYRIVKEKVKWTRIVFITGIVLLVLGALDPLEGSIIITLGSAFIALAAFATHDRHFRIFMLAFIMIAVGVAVMFYLSSLGGIGGNSSISGWWGLLIIPYPAGWFTEIILLIVRLVKKKKQQPAATL